jgi:hypothetical protein
LRRRSSAAQGEALRFDVEIRAASDESRIIDFMIAPMRGEEGAIRYQPLLSTSLSANRKSSLMRCPDHHSGALRRRHPRSGSLMR